MQNLSFIILHFPMISQWTTYNGRAYRQKIRDMRVSLNAMGRFDINAQAMAALGNPPAVELLFDEVNKRIGLRPCDLEQPNAHPLIQSHRGGRRRLFAALFLRRFEIRISMTVIFPGVFVNPEGILVLDVKKAILSPPRRRLPILTPDGSRRFLDP